MTKILNFDMDGTFVDFYGVEGWLACLLNADATPYKVARPLFNMSLFARTLNKLHSEGWEINIISWCAKNATADFDRKVIDAKTAWLARHLPSVKWDNINILPYGTPKHSVSCGILFDDEEGNRNGWGDGAYDVHNILGILKTL